jgi:hypothetical protein
LIPWLRLQREVVASVARRSLARRIYLFLALGITVLTLLASGAYALYQILRVALGASWTASNTGDLIDAASAATVAGLLLAYHLRVFQYDAALAREGEAAAPPAPAGPTPLALGSEGVGRASEQVTLLVVRPPPSVDPDALREQLRNRLPPGATIEAVQVGAAEAARLLGHD